MFCEGTFLLSRFGQAALARSPSRRVDRVGAGRAVSHELRVDSSETYLFNFFFSYIPALSNHQFHYVLVTSNTMHSYSPSG